MDAIMNFEKALEMGKRVYNSKMMIKEEDGKIVYSDEEAIKQLCSKTFTEDGKVSSFENLRSFNRMIVEVAKAEIQPKYEQIVNAVADYKTVGRYDQQVYVKIPKRGKITMALSATGSGVDFVKITASKTQVPAIPEQFQFGCKYSISEMINSPVNAFRDAVDYVVEAQLTFVFNKIMGLARDGKNAGKIPDGQFKEVSNLTLADYRKVEDKLIRAGNRVRPVLLADTSFISALALKQGTEGLAPGGTFLTDDLRTSLLRDVTIEQVSRSIALATDNPFLDEMNTKVGLEPQEALVLAGGEGSPFKITEFGGIRTAEDMPSIEKEEVLFKVDYKISVMLMTGKNLAYIKDDAITV